MGRYRNWNRTNNLGIIGILIFTTLSFSSCYKFEGDQTIPSYLKIDSISLDTYYPEEGANTQKITDAWVYINDNLIGVFELPAVVPVLKKGPNDIDIRCGIKLNGISSTRVPYPFYSPVSFENYELYEDSIHVLGSIETKYTPNLEFGWMEDFESSGLTLEEVSTSDTAIKRTIAGDPNAYLSEYSSYSGIVNLTTEKPTWSATSLNSFEIPKQGSSVLLELDFKTDNYFNVALLLKEYGQFVKIPLLTMNHSSTWNKIYINLGPNISLHPQAEYYKVVIESGLEAGKSSATIYLDNIKLVYRPI